MRSAPSDRDFPSSIVVLPCQTLRVGKKKLRRGVRALRGIQVAAPEVFDDLLVTMERGLRRLAQAGDPIALDLLASSSDDTRN
jgi:hypothetical protein